MKKIIRSKTTNVSVEIELSDSLKPGDQLHLIKHLQKVVDHYKSMEELTVAFEDAIRRMGLEVETEKRD